MTRVDKKIYILLKLQVLDLYKNSSNGKYFTLQYSANSAYNSFAGINLTLVLQIYFVKVYSP